MFGHGGLDGAGDVLGGDYTLLSTSRAIGAAPALAAAATAVHEVPTGRVDDIAGALRNDVRGELLVALGGGRVIDVAKALAAADPPRRVAAIPTTLSGAEMTGVHRHATGVRADAPRVRPTIVINDPDLCASQPSTELPASAANALGHAIEGALTPLATPVAILTGVEATRLIASGLLDGDLAPGGSGRDALALGALLAGYVIGEAWYGLHHVVSQTLVRFAGIGHGTANAIMLPHTIDALESRSPEAVARIGGAIGVSAAEIAIRVRERTGVERLRDAGVSEDQLDLCASEAATRPELQFTPPPADVAELRALYTAAY